MQVTAVDEYQDLFAVTGVVSTDLMNKILDTPWMELDYTKQPSQENWLRRLIINDQLSWYQQWIYEFQMFWPQLESSLGTKLEPYTDTAFWIDEPGFTCPIHTDGELPGSLHLSWIGDSNLGTVFYHNRNGNQIRYRNTFIPNCGYVMINRANSQGYRHLQWHGMLDPVPDNSYRLTSYTWLRPLT